MVVDIKHRYSNESEKANYDIYISNWKKSFGYHGLYTNNSAL